MTTNDRLDAITRQLGEIKAWLSSIDQALKHQHDLIHQVLTNQGNAMATQAELTKQLNDLSDQVTKIGGETTKSLQMITDLQNLLAAGGTVTPELKAAADKLALQLKAVDDLVPDAVP